MAGPCWRFCNGHGAIAERGEGDGDPQGEAADRGAVWKPHAACGPGAEAFDAWYRRQGGDPARLMSDGQVADWLAAPEAGAQGRPSTQAERDADTAALRLFFETRRAQRAYMAQAPRPPREKRA